MSIGTGSDSGSGKDRYADLAALLRDRRTALGLSRKEVCELTGLSYPYVSQLEGGYRAPSLATARKLAEALRLDVERIVVLADDAAPAAPRIPTGRSYANPAYAGARREFFASSSMIDAFAPELMSAPPADAQSARRATARRSRRRGTDEVVADAAALLTGLPADERLDALAAVQQQVIDSVISDRS